MSLENALTVVITGFVYVCVAALLTAIVIANVYAILHAWRSDRVLWTVLLAVLFLTGIGGGIATAIYLIVHHDEPMPRSATSKRHAVA